MILEVVRAGPFATVQDLGRFGHLRHGVPPSGPMDPTALEVANLLAGNSRGGAALEVALGGLSLRCLEEGLVAVTGADLDATVELLREKIARLEGGQPFPPRRPRP